MAICQIMIQDFMSGETDELGYGYGQRDLETGIQYCEDLIKLDGLKKEPFHHYDLREFIEWAKDQIRKLNVMYRWTCSTCGKTFQKNTPQGLGMARENHMRKHLRRRS